VENNLWKTKETDEIIAVLLFIDTFITPTTERVDNQILIAHSKSMIKN
jgi:hypothetical protein